MELVSVIIPVYNGERYIRQAIESVRRQTYQNFELIIVDDGSTDASVAISRSVQEEDQRISILQQVNEGSASARNHGVNSARGSLIAMLDADDTMVPERLERQTQFLLANPHIHAVSCLAYYINDRNEVIGRVYSDFTTPEAARSYVEAGNVIYCIQSGILIRKEVFTALGGYRVELLYGQDTELWNRLMEKGFSMMVMPEFLVNYRIHQASSMTHFRKRIVYSNWLIANIRLRRRGERELTFQQFVAVEKQSPILLKVIRAMGNYGAHFYRTAGLMYAEKRILRFVFYLLAAFILKPYYTLNKLMRQRRLVDHESR